MFLGFKWDALDNTKRLLGKYTWYPSLSFEEIRERLSHIFDVDKYRTPLEIADDFLDVVSSKITHDEIYYLDVTEEKSRRRSFDINVYRADLKLKALYPVFSKIYQHYAIPAKQFHSLYNPVRTSRFGHLSGGIDREGKDFFTLYFGAEDIVQNI